MNYQESWSYLDQLQFFKIKLGLESMNSFLGKVGHPHQRLSFVHVAGTNGKGSVSSTLLTLLAAAGYRVGLYTSPHLSSVRERFRINDTYISEDDFASISGRIRDVLGDGQITYFEFTTALALLWFEQQEVDLAILEVGLGGRLDATNVVSPLVSVITNVSMDHEMHLGDSLEAIAREKAGVIKKGVPLITGVANDVGRQVIEETCVRRKAPYYLLGRDFGVSRHDDGSWDFDGRQGEQLSGLKCRMKGDYQIDNAALALGVVEELASSGFAVDSGQIASSLPQVRWPGRLEDFCLKADGSICSDDSTDPDRRYYLLDGAHNPAGVASLCKSLDDDFTYDRLICVWASMGDKDIAGSLGPLISYCDKFIFVRPEENRSATAGELIDFLPDDTRSQAQGADTVEEALELARNEATVGDLICVAGSLYLVGAARPLLLGELV